MWSSVCEHISTSTNQPFEIQERKEIAGGDISRTYRISDVSRSFFVKVNELTRLELFEAEALALQQLNHTHTIQVPGVICSGTSKACSYLVLDWIELTPGSPQAWRIAGEQLARLHTETEQKMYGWDTDNFIGTNIQPNRWQNNWSTFFAEQRIGWQLELALEKGMRFGEIDTLVEKAHHILLHHKPQPSLLHGDLWSGNIAFHHNEPVIFDPASYWGDRETDIAMTRLFDRFHSAFYQGYEDRKSVV